MREAVRGADERDVRKLRMLELRSDPDERAARVERAAQELEERRAVLEDLEQPPVRRELVLAHLVEEPRCAADEQPPLVVGRARERSAERREELSLLAGQLGLREPLPEKRRTERQPGDAIVEVLARPRREPGVHRPLERRDALRHAA